MWGEPREFVRDIWGATGPRECREILEMRRRESGGYETPGMRGGIPGMCAGDLGGGDLRDPGNAGGDPGNEYVGVGGGHSGGCRTPGMRGGPPRIGTGRALLGRAQREQFRPCRDKPGHVGTCRAGFPQGFAGVPFPSGIRQWGAGGRCPTLGGGENLVPGSLPPLLPQLQHSPADIPWNFCRESPQLERGRDLADPGKNPDLSPPPHL